MSAGTPSVRTFGGRLQKVSNTHSVAPGRRFRPSSEARVVFFRSLAVMFRAGVPVERSLMLLSEQIEDPQMAQVCDFVATKVRSGHYLSNAMSQCEGAFTGLQLRLIHIAESAGTMDDTLLQLSLYEERHRAMVMKVKGAITYPAFTFAVAFLMLILIPPYLMEGIFQMVTGLGQELPLLTRCVMMVCSVLRSGWFYLFGVLALVGLSIGLPKLWQREEVRYHVHHLLLKMPLLGETLRTVAVARFSRALAVQLGVGIAPLVALSLAAKASDNAVLEEQIETSVSALRDGSHLEESLAACGFFPAMVLHMVKAGEESGALADMLTRMADIYEFELENTLEVFTSLLEPMVMLFMGGVVGVLVISTMTPMMNVIKSL